MPCNSARFSVASCLVQSIRSTWNELNTDRLGTVCATWAGVTRKGNDSAAAGAASPAVNVLPVSHLPPQLRSSVISHMDNIHREDDLGNKVAILSTQISDYVIFSWFSLPLQKRNSEHRRLWAGLLASGDQLYSLLNGPRSLRKQMRLNTCIYLHLYKIGV